jgi:superfamily II DNA or RNA helicase
MSRKLTTEEFIKRAKEVHGDKYDYSKVEYKSAKEKVCIICPLHGEFWQIPSNHLHGYGCPKCSGKNRTTEDFIAEARKIHGDKYDYSKVEYVNTKTKVCIICPEHGEFWQNPCDHLIGKGCPKCSGVNKSNTEEFVKKAKEIHGDKYDYSKVFYINNKTKVCIICTEHGEFWQTPINHLNGQGCPICCESGTVIGKEYRRQYKLSLLECDDLIHMSSHQLIEIIANKKLPTEFKSLAYTHPDSESRIGAIRDLIDLFSDDSKTEDEIENEASQQAQNRENELSSNTELNNEFNLILGDSEDVPEDETEPSLPSMVIGNAHVFDDLVHMKPSDEAAKFLVLEETHRIWNGVLRANEEGKLDEIIEKIKTEDGGEFWKYIQTTFLNEFNEVVSSEKGDDYKFPYDPSLMQKLMVYYLTNNKSFGNWCGTGAGKTNAFLFATRKTNSRVTVAIVPNDVIDTLVKAINNIYPDSNIIIPQSSDELFTCDRSKFNYIIYNYEKFQGNNGAEDTINKLLETNTIDFICLDEVQNVKVRDIESASSRSQFINNLVLRARINNPEMRTLAMSATPCINNLTEVRSIIELLTGVEHNEIGSYSSIANIHNAYKALLLNGFRYVPKYPIIIKERTVDIDCTDDSELYLNLISKDSGDISGIEYVLAEKKLKQLKKELKPGTIVYATWVDGMSEMLTKNIKKMGFSVESYNGKSGNKEGRKEILDRFLNGKTDVLVCSKPISTGVDGLQYKCNKIIIISLPWTDADYTQLMGRIYRQGSVFDCAEFVILQVVINTPKCEWSWDKMRKQAIDTKKSLGSAVVDGNIQESYTINKEMLLSKAMEALKEGIIDIEYDRNPITADITYIKKEREYSESFINNVHSLANRSLSKTTHARYVNNPEEFKEYHRQREISKESWLEDPVDRVADIINSWSNRYTRIIDMGCGMNKLKTLVVDSKTVQGVDHINISSDTTVIEADMSNLNGIVDSNSYDVAVFCLSLWGVNYKDYFNEAYRILDDDGRMIIVEPSSKFGVDEHFSTIDEFVDDIENYGFERTGKIETHNNFVYLKFTKF